MKHVETHCQRTTYLFISIVSLYISLLICYLFQKLDHPIHLGDQKPGQKEPRDPERERQNRKYHPENPKHSVRRHINLLDSASGGINPRRILRIYSCPSEPCEHPALNGRAGVSLFCDRQDADINCQDEHTWDHVSVCYYLYFRVTITVPDKTVKVFMQSCRKSASFFFWGPRMNHLRVNQTAGAALTALSKKDGEAGTESRRKVGLNSRGESPPFC